MKTDDYQTIIEEIDSDLPPVTFERIRKPAGHGLKKMPDSMAQFIHSQDDSVDSFQFTYHASRHEQSWLLESLGSIYEENWISDILRMVKGGKEATVYLCAAGHSVRASMLAAKIYRPRMLRNLKNDQLYREGRAVLDKDSHIVKDLGMLKAEHKRSVYGEQIRHQSWIAYEFMSLKKLHAAGANVPEPYEMGINAILMGYIGDEQSGAPTLNTVSLHPAEVKPLFDRVLKNIDIMLASRIVHGDLSAYNILYWDGQITLIDFPQVISPLGHRSAYQIFSRDIKRLCEYFARQGLQTAPARLAADLWRSHGYRLGPEIHPRDLDADDPRDRKLWKEG
jgi:RIO kinase 1